MKPDHIPSQKLTDETLCRLAASGDRVAEERLVMRYNRLVRMCARPYFLAWIELLLRHSLLCS